MYLAYYDESGDDGLKKGASALFVLSCVYLPKDNWDKAFLQIKATRRFLRQEYGIPLKQEIHTRHFLAHKKRYHSLGLSPNRRNQFMLDYCSRIGELHPYLRTVNIVINKGARYNDNYKVLESAVTYSLNRIHTHVDATDILWKTLGVSLRGSSRLFILTDPGRAAQMRKTIRRIQVNNATPHKGKPGKYQNPLRRILGDLSTAESKHSYFIQLSDVIATLISQHMRLQLGIGEISGSFKKTVSYEEIVKWLDALDPIFNKKASTENKYGYGIVCFPR